MLRWIVCVLAAVVGAGFASGREIIRFFSRWGVMSWPLIVLCAVSAAAMAYRMMRQAGTLFQAGRASRLASWILAAMYLCVAGGMAASAGELAALTVPARHARSLGLLCTLAGCAAMSGKPLNALRRMGYILIPLLIAAWTMCLRLPRAVEVHVALPYAPINYLLSPLLTLFYCAMNMTLCTGVMQNVAFQCNRKQQKRLAAGIGVSLGLMLCLGNAAFLPHIGLLLSQPLPTVMLLRSFGKTGFYLSAAVLYLAVVTTLIAALTAVRGLLPVHGIAGSLVFAAAGAIACLGFSQIVAWAYPALGAMGILLMLPRKKREQAAPADSPFPQESRYNS